MELEFDVKMKSGVLYDYMLHHTYSGFSGILGTAVGSLIIAAYFTSGSFIYLIAGMVILFYLPCSLYLRSKQQMLGTPAFKEALHYRLAEEGVTISQGEMKEEQAWETIHRAVSTRTSIILYTSPVNASIFPRKDLGSMTPKVIEMISTHMSPEKVKIRG